MLVTIVYTYTYLAYCTWIVGGITIAYFLYESLRVPSRLLASIAGVVFAFGAACLIGFFRLDLSVVHRVEFYQYFSNWKFTRIDYFHRIPRTLLLDLAPFFYAYRFLKPPGTPNWHQGVVPCLAAGLALSSEWEGLYRFKDSMVVAFLHFVAGAILVSRPAKEPDSTPFAHQERLRRQLRKLYYATSLFLLIALALLAAVGPFHILHVPIMIMDWALTFLVPILMWLYLFSCSKPL